MYTNDSFRPEQIIKLQTELQNFNFQRYEVSAILADPKKYLLGLRNLLKGTHQIKKRPDIVSYKDFQIPEKLKIFSPEGLEAVNDKHPEETKELKATKAGIFFPQDNKWTRARTLFFQSEKQKDGFGTNLYAVFEEAKTIIYKKLRDEKLFLAPPVLGQHYAYLDGENIPKTWPKAEGSQATAYYFPESIFVEPATGKRYMACLYYWEESEGAWETRFTFDCMDTEWVYANAFFVMLNFSNKSKKK